LAVGAGSCPVWADWTGDVVGIEWEISLAFHKVSPDSESHKVSIENLEDVAESPEDVVEKKKKEKEKREHQKHRFL
jgi:hypothetical protein